MQRGVIIFVASCFVACAVAGSNVTDEAEESRALSDDERAAIAAKLEDTFKLKSVVRTPSGVVSISFKSLRGVAVPQFARDVAAVVAPMLPSDVEVRSICIHEDLGASLDKLGKVQPECVALGSSDAGVSDGGSR
ncbi:MAG: hypothetical protein QM817_38880 [Archangium sp.]